MTRAAQRALTGLRAAGNAHEAEAAPLAPIVAAAAPVARSTAETANRQMMASRLPQRPLRDEERAWLLHYRMAHINMRQLVDGFTRMRFTGYTIPRQILGTRALVQMHQCDACGRCKQRRRNFHRSRALDERPEEERAGETLCLDIHVFMNCPAHDGTAYRANFTDPVSTATFSYGLVTKSQLQECFDLVVAEYHTKYNLRPWRILHCDQEGALRGKDAQV